MRHIKKSDLRSRIKEVWLAAAEAGLQEIKKKKTRKARSSYIKKFFVRHSALWTELKHCMAQPLPAKCWYSEVQRPISDLEIDHFRPKNAISGIKHTGYWWLAFNWENFRVCSPLANKRRADIRAGTVEGKGTFFPLVEEGKRVSDIDIASTDDEKPILLDPFVASDVLLLDYHVESGKVVEKFSEAKHKVKHIRAKKSIELYHLNDGTIITQRAERGVALKAKATRIEALFSKQECGVILNDKENEELEQLQSDVAGYINANAEYSAFFRALLQQLGNRGWNVELLTIS